MLRFLVSGPEGLAAVQPPLQRGGPRGPQPQEPYPLLGLPLGIGLPLQMLGVLLRLISHLL